MTNKKVKPTQESLKVRKKRTSGVILNQKRKTNSFAYSTQQTFRFPEFYSIHFLRRLNFYQKQSISQEIQFQEGEKGYTLTGYKNGRHNEARPVVSKGIQN